MVLSNCHTHTTFCDGKSTAEEMVLAALELNFKSLGFTSHSVQHFDTYAMRFSEEESYRAEIRRLQEKYRRQITIWDGIERDYFSCADIRSYSYYIASVHYIPFNYRFYAVDGDPEALEELLNTAYKGDGLALVRDYYNLVGLYACTYCPPILGHFDLIKKYQTSLSLFDSKDDRYFYLAEDALRQVDPSETLLEVNTGGMARGYLNDPYPSEPLLKSWLHMGGRVILSSDCHQAKQMAFAFEETIAMLKRTGYKKVALLGQERLFEEQSIE